MTDDEYEDGVAAAIQAGTEGLILCRWVVVAEWMFPDGATDLSRAYPSGMPAWQLRGLLHEALREKSWDDEDA